MRRPKPGSGQRDGSLRRRGGHALPASALSPIWARPRLELLNLGCGGNVFT